MLLALLWGSSFLFFELGLTDIPPITLVFWRVGLASVFLLTLFSRRLQRLRQIWQLRYRMLLLGCLGCAAPFSCYAYGQLYVSSSFAGVANAAMPLFTYLLASMLGMERFKLLRMTGIVIGLGGIMVLLRSNSDAGTDNWLLGGLLCVLAPVFYAISTVIVRQHSDDIDYMTMATGMIVGATALTIPPMLIIEGFPTVVGIAPLAMLATVGMALLGTALAYRVFMHLIGTVGSSNASLAVLLVPFVAIVLGNVFLDERLDRYFAVATLLIVISFLCIDEQLRSLLARLASRLGCRA